MRTAKKGQTPVQVRFCWDAKPARSHFPNVPCHHSPELPHAHHLHSCPLPNLPAPPTSPLLVAPPRLGRFLITPHPVHAQLSRWGGGTLLGCNPQFWLSPPLHRSPSWLPRRSSAHPTPPRSAGASFPANLPSCRGLPSPRSPSGGCLRPRGIPASPPSPAAPFSAPHPSPPPDLSRRALPRHPKLRPEPAQQPLPRQRSPSPVRGAPGGHDPAVGLLQRRPIPAQVERHEGATPPSRPPLRTAAQWGRLGRRLPAPPGLALLLRRRLRCSEEGAAETPRTRTSCSGRAFAGEGSRVTTPARPRERARLPGAEAWEERGARQSLSRAGKVGFIHRRRWPHAIQLVLDLQQFL